MISHAPSASPDTWPSPSLIPLVSSVKERWKDIRALGSQQVLNGTFAVESGLACTGRTRVLFLGSVNLVCCAGRCGFGGERGRRGGAT